MSPSLEHGHEIHRRLTADNFLSQKLTALADIPMKKKSVILQYSAELPEFPIVEMIFPMIDDGAAVT